MTPSLLSQAALWPAAAFAAAAVALFAAAVVLSPRLPGPRAPFAVRLACDAAAIVCVVCSLIAVR